EAGNNALKGKRGTLIRNESASSSKYFLAESSDKDTPVQYLRPNLHPIYQDNTLDPPWRGLAEQAQQALQVARRAKGVYHASPSCDGRESRSRCSTAHARYRAQGGAGGAGTGRLDRGPTHAALPQWI